MSRIITLLTDFGSSDVFVGVMKGVILGISRAARVVDLTHEIAPQNVMAGALQLVAAVPYFPVGTIHVAVVDPGVGSDRRPLAIETETGILVGPDNGLLSLAARAMGWRRAFELRHGPYTLPHISHTFHGRDIFAPVAAHLAEGVALAACGTVVPAIAEIKVPEASVRGGTIQGEVLAVDHFGNLLTNVGADLLGLGAPSVRDHAVHVGGRVILGVSRSYAEVPDGSPLALVSSTGSLEIAVRNGSAAQMLGVGVGSRVTVVEEDVPA